MNKCPKCGNSITPHIKYNAGYPVIEYHCGCGYSTDNDSFVTDNKTYMPQNIHDEII